MRTVESSLADERSNPSRRRFAIPKSRATVNDILRLDRKVPSFPHCREIDLTKLDAARAEAECRLSWTVLFIKAFGLLAKDEPALRQMWMSWPWPHLYQSPYSVGFLPMKRRFQDEEWLCFARYSEPENQTLREMQRELERYRTEPVDTMFRNQFRAASLPGWLRRIVLSVWFYGMAQKRAKRLGTFGVTTVSGRGATIQYPPGVQTVIMTYGPIDEAGKSRVTFHYDHRIMDGWYVAELLEKLEGILNGEILEEVRG